MYSEAQSAEARLGYTAPQHAAKSELHNTTPGQTALRDLDEDLHPDSGDPDTGAAPDLRSDGSLMELSDLRARLPGVRAARSRHDAIDVYLRDAGDHRLLVAREEQELSRGMREARVKRALCLFRWSKVPTELLRGHVDSVLESDKAARACFARLRAAHVGDLAQVGAQAQADEQAQADDRPQQIAPSAQHPLSPAHAEAATLPWREAKLQPFAAEWQHLFRRTQAVERAVRQLCLFTAGMPRRYYAERLPADLLDTRWLAVAARARVISAGAYAVLRLELAPVLAPLLAIVRSTGMNIGLLRDGYRRFRETDRTYRGLRDELARHNLRLVIAMARKYERPGMPLADLIQEGNVGLLRAIDKFDPDLGYRFSTYATWWVRQSLQRAQLEQGRVVRVPAHVQEEARLLYRTTETFVHAHGREPRNDELVRLSGLSMARLNTLRALYAEAMSLDVARHDDGDESWHAHIAGDVEGGDIDRERAEMAAALDRLLQSLPRQQAQLLRLRFGVGARAEHSTEMLRAVLNLSPARLRELERQALSALRERGESLRVFLE